MFIYFKEFFSNLSKPKNWLLLVNIFLVFFLILLSNLKIIPLQLGDFVFFAILGLAFALWRPGWAFLLFIGTIMLENINLAPAELGIAVRPYQFIGALIILAIIIRLITKRLNLQLAKLKLADYLVIIMLVATIVATNSPKLSVIFASFAILYYLTRCYIQNLNDLKKVIPFFISSSVVVVLYGIWQNIRFIYGGNNFETMPGRPNATFTEPDWAGLYIIVLLAVIYVLWYLILNFKFEIFKRFSKIFLYIFLILTFIALILTVSRSAWLGVFAASFIFLFIIITNLRFNYKNWRWKEFFKNLISIVSAGIISLALVHVFHLTNFQLFNRAQSVGSGLQKITIACESNLDCAVPMAIHNMQELDVCNCRHINLEDIEKEKAIGNEISEVYRDDPNVNIRAEIYQKARNEIKKHPILGIGWGNIGQILGRDSAGNHFNSSNIFLETWLGAGIFGLLALVIFFVWTFFNAVKNFYFSGDGLIKTLNIFIIISWLGIVVFNLFNAGMFLGFFWIWLAIAVMDISCP